MQPLAQTAYSINSEEDLVQYLFAAVVQDNARMLIDLLTRTGTDVNYSFGRSQRSLLHAAAGIGSVECLHVLARRGANLELRDRSQMTPLLLAARNNHQHFVRTLVEDYHADITAKDADGSTILHWLACNGRTELLRFALSFSIPVDIEDSRGQGPLHVACQSGHVSSVLSLLDNRADVNKPDANGRTPIFCVCKFNQYNVLRLLIDRGAQFLVDSHGADPLDECLASGAKECAALLLSSYPGMVGRLVQRCSRNSVDVEKVHSILVKVCSTSTKMLRDVVLCIVDLTLVAGQQVQSCALYLCLTRIHHHIVAMPI